MAERALAKGISNAILRTAVERIAIRYGAASTLGLTGWGTALLGLAMLFEVGAILMTPSEMEKWVSRSYFGKSSKKKYRSWAEEEAALKALFAPTDPAGSKQRQASAPQGPQSISELGPMP